MMEIRRRGSGRSVQIKQNETSVQGVSLEYLTFPVLEQTGIVEHLFSTRTGGVSEGIFSTMNLHFNRGDDPEKVLENYRRISSILHSSPEDMVGSDQTHTTNIRRVSRQDRGKGIVCPKDYTDIDGLITDEPGIVLVTYYADCVPLYFVDPVHRAIGLSHSGWKGTAAGMGQCTVRAMQEAFQTDPKDLYAAIGPSICVDCYEVSEDVAQQFMQYEGVVFPGRQPGKYQLDLWEANRQILVRAGISDDHIQVPDICTCCNESYLFSHRATAGKRGNLAAFLKLKDF